MLVPCERARIWRAATKETKKISAMDIAKRLLSQGTEPVEQIAYKAGFASYDAMRKAFARRVGATPTTFRKRFAPRHIAPIEPSGHGSGPSYAP